MTYDAETVDDYISQIPADRKDAFSRLRSVIGSHLPGEFEERLSWGMPTWAVPLSVYPPGYHTRKDEPLPFISIASQKHFIGFYHLGIYAMPQLHEWFLAEWTSRNLGRMDMGKSCLRLKNPDKIPYDLLGELCSKVGAAEWIAIYEGSVRN